MNQLSFHFEKLACFIIITNFLHDIDRGPEWWEFLGLVIVISLGLKRDKASIKTIFLLLAVPFEVLYGLTDWKGFYVISTLLCFLNMWFPDRHYTLPKVPDGVGYKNFRLPEKYGNLEACLFYPYGEEVKNGEETKSVQKPKKKVAWLIPSFLEKMMGNDRSPFKVPPWLFRLFTSFMQRYTLSFEIDQKINNPHDELIIFSHGLSANIHAYSTILTRLAQRPILCIQHTEEYSFSSVPIERRRVEILGRAKDVLNAFDFMQDPEEASRVLRSEWHAPKNIILMGHSYGGGTTIQALKDRGDRQFMCGVLLDPWLEAVNHSILKETVSVPLLSLENEFFTVGGIKRCNDMLKSSNKNVIRFALARADHLHQCDLSFILGNMLKIVKRPQKSLQFTQVNVYLISLFLARIKEGVDLEDIEQEMKFKVGKVFVEERKEDAAAASENDKKQL